MQECKDETVLSSNYQWIQLPWDENDTRQQELRLAEGGLMFGEYKILYDEVCLLTYPDCKPLYTTATSL